LSKLIGFYYIGAASYLVVLSKLIWEILKCL